MLLSLRVAGSPNGDLLDASRRAVDGAVEAQDWSEVGAALRRLWRTHAGVSQAGFVLGRIAQLPPGWAPRGGRLTVLRSFTIEPLVPVLRAAAAVEGIDLDVTVGGFNTYAQEILDPGSLLYTEWKPDIVVLAVQTRDVAPELWAGAVSPDVTLDNGAIAARVASELCSLIGALRQRSSAQVLVHGLELPAAPALGIADRAHPDGQTAAVVAINLELTAVCERLDGVHYVDFDSFVADCGRASLFDEAKWDAMRAPVRSGHLPGLAALWMRFIAPLLGRSAKVLVVDLDNTMWGGVVGEDGMDGLVIGPDGPGRHHLALQRALIALRTRGILLAVCSKNDHGDAVAALDGHPEMLLRSKDFAAVRINWDDKPSNLRSIAAELNLGLDSIAFLDDNPAERSVVSRLLPEVMVLEADDDPAGLARAVLSSPLLERISITAEDARRSELYAIERERAALQSSAATIEEFLVALETHVSMSEVVDRDVPRAAQLAQKTNQFNMTTRRYTEAQIAAMMRAEDRSVHVIRARDRYGDHGLVGLVVVADEATDWTIDTLLLSCRVIGRDIDRAILHVLSRRAAAAGASRLVGRFEPTAKNAPAAGCYEKAGFVVTSGDADRGSTWTWDLSRGAVDAPAWVGIDARYESEERVWST